MNVIMCDVVYVMNLKPNVLKHFKWMLRQSH